MCHLLIKWGLKRRRLVATRPTNTLYRSTDRDSGLRGGPSLFIHKSRVASCSTSIRSHRGKNRLCAEKSELPDDLQCGSSVKSIQTLKMLNVLLVSVLTIFYQISQENILVSSMTIKSLLLAWVNECKCTFTHLVFRKISRWKWKFCHLPFIKDNFTIAKGVQVINIFFFCPLQIKTSDQFTCEIFFSFFFFFFLFFLKILSTIKGELRLWWKSKEHRQIWALLSFWIAFLLLSSFKWFSMAGTFFLISHS